VFKDFKNHVLHPRDGFWGGAPATARQWYVKTVELLRGQRWADAVNAAGILSHYVTDAVHPFHTGQSEAENSIHRAFEWSTAKSYDALKAAAPGEMARAVTVPDGNDWLEQMLQQGALRANRHYEKLIAHYDINRGVVDPPAGLDVVAQRIVGDLILHAVRLYRAILERAIAEAGMAPPEVSLTLDTVLAAIQMPLKQLQKRLADAADRRVVEAMYDELRATGTVEASLPEDDRTVRDLHRAEVLGEAPGELAGPTAAPAAPNAAERPVLMPTLAMGRAIEAAKTEPVQAESALQNAPRPPMEAPLEAPARTPPMVPAEAEVAAVSEPEPKPIGSVATSAGGSVPSIRPRHAGGGSATRMRLAPADDIVDAPSIGPRMAERLRPLGILTVHDLLVEEPAALANALGVAHVNAATIVDWQAQAQLVCTVPGLSGTVAQLLVGAGYRTREQIAAVEPDKLSADVLAFAASDKGRRVLRDGEPPDVARIKAWAEGARVAMAA